MATGGESHHAEGLWDGTGEVRAVETSHTYHQLYDTDTDIIRKCWLLIFWDPKWFGEVVEVQSLLKTQAASQRAVGCNRWWVVYWKNIQR